MKFFNYTFIIIFILFAAVQYNDPDPYIWIPIYLYPAFLCYKSAKNVKLNINFYRLGFLIFGLYALYKFFDENGIYDWVKYHHAENIASTMKAEQPWIEESREFFGLIIIIIVLMINYKKQKKINEV
jgi:hypothetical protein